MRKIITMITNHISVEKYYHDEHDTSVGVYLIYTKQFEPLCFIRK